MPHASPGPGPGHTPLEEYDYGDLEYEYGLDLDSEEDFSSEEEEGEGEDLSPVEEEVNRVKRRVVFGVGGGYGGSKRRGGGGGDPFRRDRGGHNYHGPGPDYGWPYYGSYGEFVDTSGFDQSSSVHAPSYDHTVQPTSAPVATTSRSRTYGIVRKSPSDTGSRRGNTRSRQGHRDTKKKLSKALKEEIARYALDHSIQDAVHNYSASVGRRLSRKKVEKFVSRYQARLGRTNGKN